MIPFGAVLPPVSGAVVAILLTTVAGALQSVDQSASVSGRVLGAESKKGLSHTPVVAVSDGGRVVTITDLDGQFELSGLKPGRYWIRAEPRRRPVTYHGQRSPGDAADSIILKPGERIASVDIWAPLLSVISGVVLSPHGEPVEGATVGVTDSEQSSLRVTQTNDLGEFRVPRVVPGGYAVWAVPPIYAPDTSSPESASGVTFAPSTLDPRFARRVSVRYGESAVADIRFQAVSMGRVVGHIFHSNGAPAARAELTLGIEAGGTASAVNLVRASAVASDDGSFEFNDVPEGTYYLRALAGSQTAADLVSVVGGVSQVTSIRLLPSVTLRGLLQLTDTGPTRQCRSPVVVAIPLQSHDSREVSTAQVRPNGTFELAGLVGQYDFKVRCLGHAGWAAIKQIIAGQSAVPSESLDVARFSTDTVFRILATPLGNVLNGVVKDDTNQPCTGLAVIVSDDRKTWGKANTPYWWAIPVSPAGEFRLEGLPAGSYFAFHEPPRRISEISYSGYYDVARARSHVLTQTSSAPAQALIPCR